MAGPTKKTKTVARIAKAKGISRKAANKIRKTRKASPTKAMKGRTAKRKSNAATYKALPQDTKDFLKKATGVKGKAGSKARQRIGAGVTKPKAKPKSENPAITAMRSAALKGASKVERAAALRSGGSNRKR